MTSLPFGLSSAPHTFAVITNWVAETLRSRGMRVIVYLDFLLASQNRDKLDSQTKEAVGLLESLGWHVNHTKCVMTPSQEIEFLGVIWNTCKNRIILPEKKVQKITKLVTDIRSRSRATLKQVQCLLGLLNFRHPQRSASLPLSSKILHDLQTEEMEGKSVDSQGSRCRAAVVVQSHDLHLRPPQEKDHAFPNHRRGRYRMGSSIEWHLSLRKLVNGAEEVALESQEDVRSLCIDKTRGAHPPESPHPPTNRQSYTSGLYPEGRGHEVSRSSQSHAPITEISGQPPNRAISGLPPGEIQRHCRSSYQEEGSVGVASPPRSDKPDFQKVGRARHRPLRISRIAEKQ
ncbi:transposon ty3-i gag-pol polyprotein [Lasius niger]|uniref:Transposon ty3-i gag-pol polyprotein n=1 Tax=Lasius niger TaxID=67767 RepID=A0A0J7N3L8_LASNI|nr:transposon ty3-i gag-pol polyprotein [Lasius niger]